MQKPDSGLSLVADDKARSSAWSVRTVDHIAALRKQLMDDSRHWELVSESRSHVIQECQDLHLELQKILGKRVCHAKSWNETSLPYMYNTLKSKCFDTSRSDLGRTCRKPGHSCLRRSGGGGGVGWGWGGVGWGGGGGGGVGGGVGGGGGGGVDPVLMACVNPNDIAAGSLTPGVPATPSPRRRRTLRHKVVVVVVRTWCNARLSVHSSARVH